MRRRDFIASLGGAALMWPRAARAQQAKTARIGILRPGVLRDASLDSFLRSLRDLGYIEGQNVAVEFRSADGRADRLPALARELVGLKVDVIVAEHSPTIQAVRRETRTIPIVMAASADPIGAGLIASLARPGGNITGLSRLAPEAIQKRLELLQATLPNAKRVAFIWDPANPGLSLQFQAVQVAARALGLEIQSLEVRAPNELQGALDSAGSEHAAALLVPSPIVGAYRRQIVDFATKNRMPLVYDGREFVEGSVVVMSYGSSLSDLWRRAAIYVDKILKGAKPADLPVEQPIKFELVINRKAAKAFGIEIPLKVLALADEVIE